MTSKNPKAFDHIPVIDICGLYSNDLEQQKLVATQLGHAAENVGFFYITGHKIPPQIFEKLLNQAKAFFALPLDEKMKYYAELHGIKHRGYVPVGEEGYGSADEDSPDDNKEAFDLSWDLPENDPDVLANKPMHGSNVWADLPEFQQDVSDYYQEVIALGRVLLRGFELALGLKLNDLNQLVNKPTSQLRLLHYAYNPNIEDKLGFGAHTDMELFTILKPTTSGLEVMNSEGVWIDAPPIENAYVINIGDMTEALSGGRFIATSHRVRKVKEERYSFPLFFACDYDVIIEPLPQFSTIESRQKYPPLKAGQHLFEVSAKGFRYMKRMVRNGEIILSGNDVTFGKHRTDISSETE
ncbi:isopenicillin N synthase family oxygenase [Acinetobacter qingfengensis]|uniref:2OG-Fe(II) oxygenase n=1 Tax=Acinetobacter qingfengensis TaxID=1262585 RepID=A0A1E7R542_9GAMM|nr:2-oxoglutarate and iron-dependent oxygenase domain-containing protein [Acinetobacter qingfengensis]KAA8732427.1 isopenicillin N synthase family oxygenase [Acinetobacter qingfengensis]OEY94421.1 2OG-Fe(II) oxygenase [Acinetobacter qingfengensis]